jgi:hypothetical protein
LEQIVEKNNEAKIALGLTIVYLEKLLLLGTVLPVSTLEYHKNLINNEESMIIDA